MAHFELVETMAPNAVIKVIGVGGGGGNAVAHMVASSVDGVEFITANTDSQAIKNCGAKQQLQLGGNVTKGLGAGANPEVGRQAALEDRDRIIEALTGADMVFITAGMGGGTGTGAAPVVAQLAKEMGILTVAVVTKPFPFEGRRRMQVALKGIEELSTHCDSLITIPNEKLITVLGRNATMIQAFRAANDVLLGAVQGIADLIVRPGLINVDFADVRTVMSEMGLAMMGTGAARGDDRAQAAAEAAIQNPLLDDVNLSGANGILVNITAGPDFTMAEFDEVGRTVEGFASEDATVVVGTVLDPNMQDEVRVTVVATGLNRAVARQPVRGTDLGGGYQPRETVRAPIKLVRDATTGLPVDAVPLPNTTATGKIDPVMGATQGLGLRRNAGTEPSVGGPAGAAELPDNYLDIPAFLRRQAD
ncbi:MULTISPECIES: cell division protein FtsZ [Pseudoxanthomonas]|uniref:Cell division protein FtsZ n=1 Tax=Pseudoxanthomonas winnipegensis TaxID=2480810 RepID=A0A4Q8LPL8_9GAMM|nr:cell division protein FtsZ [Pseudoxanthomonas winnipegensis]MDQ1120196.1 cell division protein FtsZ [Pseudoxanthomonas winnipegensis]RZZ83064.1 cell division protein FtsZ [Pseudoxanthomonas winnipegensis]RZZ89355.1 cell division protein FtsZ [Pseudoxanthomonas winnipegensis]TAA10117.1 cell division protein FtsZ [Pseudoxanthomonas winnipegensis]TAA22502.1 cell division protein FtsZ [Pseudoxanthomonas winnipegensis]